MLYIVKVWRTKILASSWSKGNLLLYLGPTKRERSVWADWGGEPRGPEQATGADKAVSCKILQAAQLDTLMAAGEALDRGLWSTQQANWARSWCAWSHATSVGSGSSCNEEWESGSKMPYRLGKDRE